ncbi:MAG TPA: hypothetical protein ENF52_00205 [Chloroflexi bacterium]|nr:hypothetical protein [Chloroflexota bacterium]
MRKVKLVSVFVLLALLLGGGVGAAMAQEPQPPDAPRPTRPTVTRSYKLEWVTMETEDGEKQVPVTVNRLEAVQTVNVPKPACHKGDTAAPNAMVGSVTVTLWRAMSWYANGNPNDPDTLWTVWTEARTSTDQCVDQVNVFAEHQYKSGSVWVDFWPGDEKHSSDSDPCEDDSGKAVSGKGFYIAGTTHRSHGIHVVYIDGQRYEWDETGPGPRTVP